MIDDAKILELAKQIAKVSFALHQHDLAMAETTPKVEAHVRENPAAGLYAAKRLLEETRRRALVEERLRGLQQELWVATGLVEGS